MGTEQDALLSPYGQLTKSPQLRANTMTIPRLASAILAHAELRPLGPLPPSRRRA